jgi:undecaprenyl-diphosphatase
VDYFQAFWLAVIQGITEFLPVSSSGHLALVPSIFGWSDQGLAFDVAVHVGTLLAVLIYFRQDISLILRDWIRSIFTGVSTIHSKLAWGIAFASILIGMVGVLLEPLVSTVARNPISIAYATLLFGVLLWLADKYGIKQRELDTLSWRDVLVIAAAQVFALIPGTSRSGVTISAGLMMGLSRQASARFSFLMAIPVIVMAGIWQVAGMISHSEEIQWPILLFGTVVAAVVAFVCIHYFLRYLQNFSLAPFAIYRLLLGIIMLIVFM